MTRLEEGLAALGLECRAGLVESLTVFADLLAKWNRTYNLTAIPAEKTVSHHLLDSLAIAPHVGAPQTLIDIGSGGGLPGIPLALYFPDTEVTLLDSNSKKTRFLEQARISLSLDNVTVVQSRVEDFVGQFDVVVSRAFSSLADFSRLTAHLLAPQGLALAMKGSVVDERGADVSPFVLVETVSLDVPGVDAERNLCKLRPNQRNT